MKIYTHLIIYLLAAVLMTVKPTHAYSQQNLDQLKAELERKKVEQQLAEAEQKRLEAEKATKLAKKEIDDAEKPAEKTPKELAEERKAISEADAASLKAKKEMLASPFTGTLSSSSISATGTSPETSILNQESLAKILAAMIKDIDISTIGQSKDKKEITLIIYNAADFNGLASYASLLDQFDQLREVYANAINETRKLLNPPKEDSPLNAAGGVDAVSLGLTAVNSLVQTVGGIIQLFRTDVSITNSDLPIDDFNLTSLMVAAIRNQRMPWTVYYPAIYPVGIVKPIGNISKLQEKLKGNGTDDKGLDGQSAKAKTELINVDNKIKELTDKTAKKQNGKEIKLSPKEEALLANLKIAKTNMQVAEKAYSDILTALNTVDPAAKLTPLVMMTRIERLSNVLTQDDDTYVVKMAATAIGSQKIMKSTVKRTRMEHSAGAVLSYEVFSPTGKVICGAGVYNYSPYQESANIVRKSSIPTSFQPPAQIGTGVIGTASDTSATDKK